MATAKEIMAKKLLAAKSAAQEPAPVAKVTAAVLAPVATLSLAATDTATWKPPVRVCSYVSRAPNTEIFLGDKTSFKFNGNYYSTSNSKEIYELDSLCRRQPNVFSKSA